MDYLGEWGAHKNHRSINSYFGFMISQYSIFKQGEYKENECIEDDPQMYPFLKQYANGISGILVRFPSPSPQLHNLGSKAASNMYHNCR